MRSNWQYCDSCYIFFWLLLAVISIITTFLLLLIEKSVFNQPELVEESAKTILLLIFWRAFSSFDKKYTAALTIGLIFGLSEIIFYLNDIILSGHLDVLTWRLLLTLPMHISTPLLMVFCASKKISGLGWGLLASILLHYIFNTLVINYFV